MSSHKCFSLLLLGLAVLSADISVSQEISLRMKSLGDKFAGIIPDEETDLLRNPARMVNLERVNLLTRFRRAETQVWTGGKEKLLYSPTIFFGFLAPHITALRLGGGGILEVTRARTSYDKPWQESRSIAFYDYISLQRNRSAREDFSGKHLFKLLTFLRLNSSISLGIVTGFSPTIYRHRWEEEWNQYQINPITQDTVSTYESHYRNNRDTGTDDYPLRITSLVNLGNNNSLDLSLEVVSSKEKTKSDANHPYFNWWIDESEDTIYYYYRSSIWRTQDWSQTDLPLKFKKINLEARLNKEQNATHRWYLTGRVNFGRSPISGRSENGTFSESKHYEYYRRPDTTYTIRDSSYTRSVNSTIHSGSENQFGFITALGSEIELSENLVLMGAIKAKYQRESIKRIEKRTVTKADVRDSASLSYEVTGKTVSRDISLTLPIAVECKIFSTLLLRGGVCPQLINEKTQLNGTSSIESSSYKEETRLSYSFGFGYTFRKKFSFEAYTQGNLTSLYDWEISGRMRF
ncbi:MAG: hypothetical protein AB1393_04545 [Candidatus Edwardsbacteria bacterium]